MPFGDWSTAPALRRKTTNWRGESRFTESPSTIPARMQTRCQNQTDSAIVSCCIGHTSCPSILATVPPVSQPGPARSPGRDRRGAGRWMVIPDQHDKFPLNYGRAMTILEMLTFQDRSGLIPLVGVSESRLFEWYSTQLPGGWEGSDSCTNTFFDALTVH